MARGTLVDEDALAAALREGRIGGAGLDVFVREPLPLDSPLWSTPRTILTSHVGACDGDYWTPAVDFFLENWGRFLAREPLHNLLHVSRAITAGDLRAEAPEDGFDEFRELAEFYNLMARSLRDVLGQRRTSE